MKRRIQAHHLWFPRIPRYMAAGAEFREDSARHTGDYHFRRETENTYPADALMATQQQQS